MHDTNIDLRTILRQLQAMELRLNTRLDQSLQRIESLESTLTERIDGIAQNLGGTKPDATAL